MGDAHSIVWPYGYVYYCNIPAIRPDRSAIHLLINKPPAARMADKTSSKWCYGIARKYYWSADDAPWFWYAQYPSAPDIAGNHAFLLCHSTRCHG